MIATYRSDARIEACDNAFAIFALVDGVSEVKELEDVEPEDKWSMDSEPGESEPREEGQRT